MKNCTFGEATTVGVIVGVAVTTGLGVAVGSPLLWYRPLHPTLILRHSRSNPRRLQRTAIQEFVSYLLIQQQLGQTYCNEISYIASHPWR